MTTRTSWSWALQTSMKKAHQKEGRGRGNAHQCWQEYRETERYKLAWKRHIKKEGRGRGNAHQWRREYRGIERCGLLWKRPSLTGNKLHIKMRKRSPMTERISWNWELQTSMKKAHQKEGIGRGRGNAHQWRRKYRGIDHYRLPWKRHIKNRE